MTASSLGNRLREERTRLAMTQAKAAECGGVSLNTQFKYESGRSTPDSNYLARAAEHGLDILYVVTGSREGHPLTYSRPAEALDCLRAAALYTNTLDAMNVPGLQDFLLDEIWERSLTLEDAKRLIIKCARHLGFDTPEDPDIERLKQRLPAAERLARLECVKGATELGPIAQRLNHPSPSDK